MRIQELSERKSRVLWIEHLSFKHTILLPETTPFFYLSLFLSLSQFFRFSHFLFLLLSLSEFLLFESLFHILSQVKHSKFLTEKREKKNFVKQRCWDSFLSHKHFFFASVLLQHLFPIFLLLQMMFSSDALLWQCLFQHEWNSKIKREKEIRKREEKKEKAEKDLDEKELRVESGVFDACAVVWK